MPSRTNILRHSLVMSNIEQEGEKFWRLEQFVPQQKPFCGKIFMQSADERRKQFEDVYEMNMQAGGSWGHGVCFLRSSAASVTVEQLPHWLTDCLMAAAGHDFSSPSHGNAKSLLWVSQMWTLALVCRVDDLHLLFDTLQVMKAPKKQKRCLENSLFRIHSVLKHVVKDICVSFSYWK